MASDPHETPTEDPEPITSGEGGFGQVSDLPSGRRYTELAQTLHWITAACVAGLLPAAWVFTSLPEKSPKVLPVFLVHEWLGLTVFLLILLRVFWRISHPAPALGPNTPGWLEVISKSSHWLIYLVFFAMPISGYLMVSAGGQPVSLWGVPLPALPKSVNLSKAAADWHAFGQWVVYVLLVLHILGTAYHVAIRKDGALQRMLPPQTRRDPS